jgi:hypothetical protein
MDFSNLRLLGKLKMDLRDILDEIDEEETKEASLAPQLNHDGAKAEVGQLARDSSKLEDFETKKAETEKIASLLDVLAEEDTLLDDIARLAVLADSNISKHAHMQSFDPPVSNSKKIKSIGLVSD